MRKISPVRHGGRYGNLTFGGRELRFATKLGREDQVFESLRNIAQNFAVVVRNEVINDAVVFMERRARFYIQEGRRRSGTPENSPRSQRLEDSFKSWYAEGDTAYVSMGDGIAYAEIHNLPPGTTYGINVKNYKFMLFQWWRYRGKTVAAKHVERPGVGYWTRALEDTQRELSHIIREKIDWFASRPDSHINRGGAQLRGRPRLSNNASRRSKTL